MAKKNKSSKSWRGKNNKDKAKYKWYKYRRSELCAANWILTDNKREPEAPAEAEGERDVLEADVEVFGRHEQVKDEAGETHEQAGDYHGVGAVARHVHQQHVHQEPRCEGWPGARGGRER